MKKKWSALFFLFIFLAAAKSTVAYDFTNKKIDFTDVVKPGTILKCDSLNAQIIHKNTMPKTFAWAEKNGLINVHEMTGSNHFSEKITTTRAFNKRTLCVGCWIADRVFKERVDGHDKFYVVGTYHLNNLVVDSPIAKAPVCKAKKTSDIFKERDYAIYYEYYRECKCGGDLLESLEKMDGEEALFQLKRSSSRNGHIVNISR